MKRSSFRFGARPVILTALVASWLALAFACSVDDGNPVVARRDLVSIYADTGTGTLPDGALVEGAPICDTYGGTPNAKAIALAVLTTIKTDCRISNTLVQTTSDNHSIQCFQAFVAASFECDGVKLADGTKDDNGVECTRPIGDLLSDADFDAFVEDYRATLGSKGISDADLAKVLPSLESSKSLVVGDDVPDGKYTGCAANCKDAGAACTRPAPPKDSGTTPPKDSGTDTGAPKDSGTPPKDSSAPVDSGPKDAEADG